MRAGGARSGAFEPYAAAERPQGGRRPRRRHARKAPANSAGNQGSGGLDRTAEDARETDGDQLRAIVSVVEVDEVGAEGGTDPDQHALRRMDQQVEPEEEGHAYQRVTAL